MEPAYEVSKNALDRIIWGPLDGNVLALLIIAIIALIALVCMATGARKMLRNKNDPIALGRIRATVVIGVATIVLGLIFYGTI